MILKNGLTHFSHCVHCNAQAFSCPPNTNFCPAFLVKLLQHVCSSTRSKTLKCNRRALSTFNCCFNARICLSETVSSSYFVHLFLHCFWNTFTNIETSGVVPLENKLSRNLVSNKIQLFYDSRRFFLENNQHHKHEAYFTHTTTRTKNNQAF